jgi:hypothetical protein
LCDERDNWVTGVDDGISQSFTERFSRKLTFRPSITTPRELLATFKPEGGSVPAHKTENPLDANPSAALNPDSPVPTIRTSQEIDGCISIADTHCCQSIHRKYTRVMHEIVFWKKNQCCNLFFCC